MAQMGKMLVLLGVVLVVVGLLLSWGPRIPWLGQLPGDIVIRRERFSFYFPITTSILLSLILTLILNLWRK